MGGGGAGRVEGPGPARVSFYELPLWGPVQCNTPSALALDGPACGQLEAISSMRTCPLNRRVCLSRKNGCIEVN